MTATEALERRIDELCVENERLRGQVASLIGRSFRTADKMDCLNTENAKLRELVGMMSKAIGVTVNDCHGDCIGPYECTFNGGCPIQRLMRELGIEVDE